MSSDAIFEKADSGEIKFSIYLIVIFVIFNQSECRLLMAGVQNHRNRVKEKIITNKREVESDKRIQIYRCLNDFRDMAFLQITRSIRTDIDIVLLNQIHTFQVYRIDTKLHPNEKFR